MKSIQFNLEPDSPRILAKLCGNLNDNLHLIENYLAVEIIQHGNSFRIVGPKTAIKDAQEFLEGLYQKLLNDEQFELSNKELNIALNALAKKELPDKKEKFIPEFQVIVGSRPINPHTINQERYLKRIQENDINFGIGPAGTGKTYLAILCAVAAFEKGLVKRLVLVNLAVYAIMGIDGVGKLIEKQIIEIAPLAYMRRRGVINNSFFIVDESQNTTKEQMKMFLIRIVFNSTAIITGDITQVDLPFELHHAIEVLTGVDGISITFFETLDVVRHPIVQRVVAAYEVYEQQHSQRIINDDA